MTHRFRRFILLTAALSALSACGGGGDDNVSTGASPQPTSYWDMDGYRYVSSGVPKQDFTLTGGKPIIAVNSTAQSGADSDHGVFTGGVLGFSLSSFEPGTYDVVPDQAQIVFAPPDSKWIFVSSTVGTNVNSGASRYHAVSGEIEVTRDDQGRLHLSTKKPLPMQKKFEVAGGVPGSSPTMQLSLTNVF